MMKILQFFAALSLCSIGYFSYSSFNSYDYSLNARSSGSPGGRTGSPGDGSTCTACHGGSALNSGPAQVYILSNNLENGYTPGETYTIEAKIVSLGIGKFGFELTAEKDLDNSKIGTLVATDAVKTKLVNGNNAITHKSGGTAGQDSLSWFFDWTAPAEGAGNVTLFGAFNAANGGGSGGDKIYTTFLSINEKLQPVYSIDEQTACGSYLWIDGNTYTSDNDTATYVYENGAQNGADSIVTLNLTINSTATSTDVQVACDSYEWIDGNTYTSSNSSATFTIDNGAANGCDSIVILDLTINSVNVNVTDNSPTLMADASSAFYQWLDCDNNFAALIGEENQSFTATENGNYAVEIIENGCVDTSDCFSVVSIGFDEINTGHFKLSPNPTTGNVQLSLRNLDNNASVEVLNMVGQVIYYDKVNAAKTNIDLSNQENGIYFVKVESSKGTEMIKLIKQ